MLDEHGCRQTSPEPSLQVGMNPREAGGISDHSGVFVISTWKHLTADTLDNKRLTSQGKSPSVHRERMASELESKVLFLVAKHS